MTEKKYEELIPARIFIGGVDAIEELLENEKIDVIYDLRAKLKDGLPSKLSIHQPIVDEEENQVESIKAAINAVMDSYENGKMFISIAIPGAEEQEPSQQQHYLN
ncbi:hypothetical protein J22TS1_26190 [Siminovitchia terrae]|uniref:hypothetical protein n=1 Tax=Siminovitchia terrae TaxID=1914933 RepID=UPI001B07B782|nr:hypothetical protein [Siminovitchia terrae]GIN91568.1 hypothetical protein J22TS1_26190 [Siminovitchia terrae]